MQCHESDNGRFLDDAAHPKAEQKRIDDERLQQNLQTNLELVKRLKEGLRLARKISRKEMCIVGASALCSGARSGDFQRLHMLLETIPNDIQVDAVNTADINGSPALLYASAVQDLYLAKRASVLLIEHKAFPGATNASKCTALHQACQRSNWDLIRVLVVAGCDMSVRNSHGLLCYQVCEPRTTKLSRKTEQFLWKCLSLRTAEATLRTKGEVNASANVSHPSSSRRLFDPNTGAKIFRMLFIF
jgi:ankyrin repeat protein